MTQTTTETCACSRCGAVHPRESLIEFDGQLLCPACLSEYTAVCQDCGTRIWTEDNAGTGGHPLCQRCFDRDYATCDRCGALLRLSEAYYEDSDEDNEYPYCADCYHSMIGSAIHDYGYKPEPIFYGSGPRFFGVELEIDGAGESCGSAQDILDAANTEGWEHIYIKHDGSLNDGMEIVPTPSHPEAVGALDQPLRLQEPDPGDPGPRQKGL